MNKEFILKNWNKIFLYAENEEKIISSSGRALSSRETEIAKEMGVQKPGSVRILVVDEIVKPGDTVLREICERFKLIDNPNGLTFGYGFYLKRVHRNSTVPH